MLSVFWLYSAPVKWHSVGEDGQSLRIRTQKFILSKFPPWVSAIVICAAHDVSDEQDKRKKGGHHYLWKGGWRFMEIRWCGFYHPTPSISCPRIFFICLSDVCNFFHLTLHRPCSDVVYPPILQFTCKLELPICVIMTKAITVPPPPHFPPIRIFSFLMTCSWGMRQSGNCPH